MEFNKSFKDCVKDIGVDLAEEFDRNFERKAFFDKAWDVAKRNDRGSLLLRSGNLRRSIDKSWSNDKLQFTSSLPYATIHNSGGVIVVTAKMKKYFWAMHKQALGGQVYNTKTKGVRNTAGNRKLNDLANFYKAMALKKVGSKITIKQRQYIGNHPEVNKAIERNVDKWVASIGEAFKAEFRKMS